MNSGAINEIATYLRKLDPGKIPTTNIAAVVNLLSKCWPELEGSDLHSTYSDKLDRAEQLSWDGERLSFILERHGGTVKGSTRADLHHWEVNVKANQARIVKKTYRQITPTSPRMDIKKMAEEVSDRILNHENHETLSWESDNHVVLNIGKIIPETIARTTQGRRNRFIQFLTEIMQSHGWVRKDKGNKRGFSKSDK